MSSSPFKFLDSYTRADISSYFGRERETDELFRRCFLSSILVVYGGSGTGKTSLVQCGLASRFQDSDWLPVPVRRSGDMLSSLTEAVREHTLTPKSTGDLGELVTNLYLDHFKPIWFIFDQFEELFIFGGHAESEAFFAAMRGLLEKERNAHAIFVVREEYLAELTRYERIIPGLIENRYRVERLSHHHAMNVVQQLCGAHNITCTEGFASALVERLDPESHGIELSYLQVFLDRCWRTRQGDEPFSPALLERIGHVDDLLGAFLDEQVADTPEPQRAEALLKTFVSDQGTKRQLTSTEAHEWVNTIGTAMELPDVERLLQVFVTKRLLKDRDERGRYELLHDALARQIFQRITRAEQELIEVRQFVHQAHGQFLKRGVKLTANDLTYLRPYRNQLHLKGDVKDFVEGAFGEEERKARRMKMRSRILLGGLLIFCLIGGRYLADTQKRLAAERARNLSNKLAEYAMSNVDGDPHLSYLAAERAYELDSSLAASRAVLRSYNSLYPLVASYAGTIARVAPDKNTFMVVEPEVGFKVCDLNGEVLWSKRLSSYQPDKTQFTASGKYILCIDSAVSILDLAGHVVFACDTSDWITYTNRSRFIGVGRDSIVLESADGLHVLPCKVPPLITSGSAGVVDYLDSNLIYMFCQDSLRLLSLSKTTDGKFTAAYPHQFKYVTAQPVLGNIGFRTSLGAHLFDPSSRSWRTLRKAGEREMMWTYFFKDVVVVQVGSGYTDNPAYMEVFGLNGHFDAAVKLDGFLVTHFEKNGTTLATPSGQVTDQSLLYGSDGKLIRKINGHPASFDRLGFATVADSTPDLDKVIVWHANGKVESLLLTTPVLENWSTANDCLWIEHVGDSSVIGYLSQSAVNGNRITELRCVAGERTVCYRTYAEDLAYQGRKMFARLNGNRYLLSSGDLGHVLSMPNDLLPKVPRSKDIRIWSRTAFKPTGFMEWTSVRTNSIKTIGSDSVRYSRIGYSIWRPGRYKSDTLDFLDDGIWNWGLAMDDYGLSPLGDYYSTLWTLRARGVDNEFAFDNLRVHVHNLTTGEEVQQDLLKDAEGVYWDTDGAQSAVILGRDSLYLMDYALTKPFLALPRDSSRLISKREDALLVFQNRLKQTYTIVDLSHKSAQSIILSRTDVSTPLLAITFDYRDRIRGFALNDSTLFLLRNYIAGGGLLQCFIHGRPAGTIATPGDCDLFKRNGFALLKSRRTSAVEVEWGITSNPNGQVNYYRIKSDEKNLELEQVSMLEADPGMQYHTQDSRIQHWDEILLKVDGRLFDANLPGRVLATHRLVSEYEEFPLSPSEAIRIVRQQKIYGEFWKQKNIELLVKQFEQ